MEPHTFTPGKGPVWRYRMHTGNVRSPRCCKTLMWPSSWDKQNWDSLENNILRLPGLLFNIPMKVLWCDVVLWLIGAMVSELRPCCGKNHRIIRVCCLANDPISRLLFPDIAIICVCVMLLSLSVFLSLWGSRPLASTSMFRVSLLSPLILYSADSYGISTDLSSNTAIWQTTFPIG